MIGPTPVRQQSRITNSCTHYNDAIPLVPTSVKHFVFWTRVPIIHPAIVSPKIWKRIEKDGLWGFTGSDRIAEPRKLPGEEDSEEILQLVRDAHKESHKFVLDKWPEDVWEVAWFVNPPVSLVITRFNSVLTLLCCVSAPTKHPWPGSRTRLRAQKVNIEYKQRINEEPAWRV